jgi:type IV pilus assembly protein PilC
MRIAKQQIFTTQLVTLLEAGVPLVPALQMIREPFNHRKQASHWLDPIIDGLHQGQSFSACLRKSKENFDAFYCGLVEIGEFSGQLNSLLTKISLDLKKSEMIQGQLKKALTYPLCVLFISFCLLLAMLIWVIPSFEQVFAGFNATLPPLTDFLLKLSRFVKEFFFLGLLIFVASLSFVFYLWWRFISIQKKVDRFFLRLPVIGNLIHHALLARWATTIFILQESGTPLLKAIRISARCSNHWFLHDVSVEVYRQLIQGQAVHESVILADTKQLLFKHETLQLLKVGEDSGGLVNMLQYLALFHERQLTEQLDVLMEMIEPALVVIMGLMVGGMVVALYLPLFKLGEIA